MTLKLTLSMRDNKLEIDEQDACRESEGVFSYPGGCMESKRCARCQGNMVLEPYNYSGYEGTATFVGFECKCLMCSRVERDYTVLELATTWGIPPLILERMQWSQTTFIWERKSIAKAVRAAQLAEAA
jgi:hypothetical protein